jgi:hypothetical protein
MEVLPRDLPEESEKTTKIRTKDSVLTEIRIENLPNTPLR